MKDIIIHAAMEEIRMRGLRFTMQDLATRLKVSKRSLYENFSSKENLIDEMVDIILSDMTEEEHAIFARDIPIPEKVEALLTIHPYDAEMFNTNVYEDLNACIPSNGRKSKTHGWNGSDMWKSFSRKASKKVRFVLFRSV